MTANLIEACVGDGGCWAQVLGDVAAAKGRPALFLDRDGVVVEEVNYLHRPQDLRLIAGTTELIRGANAAGIAVVIITNQAGIGRHYYGWEHFAQVQQKLIDELHAGGARVDAVYACPFHDEAFGAYRHLDHPARKPNPGMLLMARDGLGIILERSWIVGDRAIDLRAGRNAGLTGGTHVRTGHGARLNERETALALATGHFAVHTAESIAGLLDDTTPFDGLLAAQP
jgi:D-glycero-D-manno-heptose 1,7-bisphosphate phosphatase